MDYSNTIPNIIEAQDTTLSYMLSDTFRIATIQFKNNRVIITVSENNATSNAVLNAYKDNDTYSFSIDINTLELILSEEEVEIEEIIDFVEQHHGILNQKNIDILMEKIVYLRIECRILMGEIWYVILQLSNFDLESLLMTDDTLGKFRALQ